MIDTSAPESIRILAHWSFTARVQLSVESLVGVESPISATLAGLEDESLDDTSSFELTFRS